jgi:hypothetical protein
MAACRPFGDVALSVHPCRRHSGFGGGGAGDAFGGGGGASRGGCAGGARRPRQAVVQRAPPPPFALSRCHPPSSFTLEI